MRQGHSEVNLSSSPGYLLKEASSALRSSMEAALRPLGLTVTHYSCLELLAQRPGLSNSELARGTFVTRQSMNVVLRSLERDGLIERADKAPTGRALPTTLTRSGRKRRAEASALVKVVEDRMLSALNAEGAEQLTSALRSCVDSLKSTEKRPEPSDSRLHGARPNFDQSGFETDR